MRRHRVFVAINLPLQTKETLKAVFEEVKLELADTPLKPRFVRPENWDITLSFLGYQDDDSVLVISKAAELTAREFSGPTVNIERVTYGPPRDRYAHLVWVETDKETSRRLSLIKDSLENKLHESGVSFMKKNKGFTGHITLARFGFRMPVSGLPQIGRLVDAGFTAGTLDLMESELRRSGAEYSVLSRFNFSGVD